MSNDDGFENLFSMTFTQAGMAKISLPASKELEVFHLASEHCNRAIEYYLLARYAFIHAMDSSFMINSFWAVEHLILSILVFKVEEKEDLRDMGFHSITAYWKQAKIMLPPEKGLQMSKFDNYIAKVQGYFSERYPKTTQKIKLQYIGKPPRVLPRDEKKALKFSYVAHLNIDEIDYFVNFMLRHITVYGNGSVYDVSGNMMSVLMMQDNVKLYQQDNKYSIIYPNPSELLV